MAKPLKEVAQYAMDAYYQAYKGDNDFFDIEDFVFHVGAAVSSVYTSFFSQEYQAIKGEKKDEAVAFDPSWMLDKTLEVKNDGGDLYALLDFSVMSFPFDRVSTGIQDVFITEPVSKDNSECERVGFSSVWQLKYLPINNRIYWYMDNKKITFYKKGDCNVKSVKVYYIPAVEENMNIPDGIIDAVVTGAVMKMKEMDKGVIVKKTLDGNENVTPASEMNKLAIK